MKGSAGPDMMFMGRAEIGGGIVCRVISRTYRNYLAMRDLGAGKFLSDDSIERNPFNRSGCAQWDRHMLNGYDSFRGTVVMETFFDSAGLAAFRENYTFFYRPRLSERKKGVIYDGNRRGAGTPQWSNGMHATEEEAGRLMRSPSWRDRLAAVRMASLLQDTAATREIVRVACRDGSASVRRAAVDRTLGLRVPVDTYARMLLHDPDETLREEAAVELCRLCCGLEPFMPEVSRDPCPMTRATALLAQRRYEGNDHIDHFINDPDNLVRCAAAWSWPDPERDVEMAVALVNDDVDVFRYLMRRMSPSMEIYTHMLNEFMKRSGSREIQASAAMMLLGGSQ